MSKKTLRLLAILLLVVLPVVTVAQVSLSDPVFADNFRLFTYAWTVFESADGSAIADYANYGNADNWQFVVNGSDHDFFTALPRKSGPFQDFRVQLIAPIEDETPHWFGILLFNQEATIYHVQINVHGGEYRVVMKRAGKKPVQIAHGPLPRSTVEGVVLTVAVANGVIEFSVNGERVNRFAIDGRRFWTGISASGTGTLRPIYFEVSV